MRSARRYHRTIGDDSLLDKRYREQYGHGFYKIYEAGDEDKAVFPERDTLCGNGMLLYHRYRKAVFPSYEMGSLRMRGYDPEIPHVYMTKCYCNHYGSLCKECRSLNTTSFWGLDIPLCPEDFREVKTLLVDNLGWTMLGWYAWLSFWIEQIGLRYSDRDRLVFWSYSTFGCHSAHNSPHKMFRYLMNGIRRHARDENDRTGANRSCVITRIQTSRTYDRARCC